MENYRVWEANRKVFLYPENWIEPELRDDKSALFQALEDELLQNEVNELHHRGRASSATSKALDGIGFLEVDRRLLPGRHPHDARLRPHQGRRSGAVLPPHVREGALLDALGAGRARHHQRQPAGLRAQQPAAPGLAGDQRGDRSGSRTSRRPASSNRPSSGPMQQPEARLRIQLAVSEYANGFVEAEARSRRMRWSRRTSFTTDPIDELDRSGFNLLYNQFSDQIWLFHTARSTATGNTTSSMACSTSPAARAIPRSCRSRRDLPDFYPDYKDSLLQQAALFRGRPGQCRHAGDPQHPDHVLRCFAVRLDKTPGCFRSPIRTSSR